MKYYEQEHFDAYARIRRDRLDQWDDLHDGDQGRGYDNFSNKTFLSERMPVVDDAPRVLEYGCGTGAAACFLAARGYRVDAIDLVPDAIEVARQRAAERDLSVRFAVGDVCLWGDSEERYDFVVDAFCLQSIVLDEDRRRVLEGVRRRLDPGGRYLLSSAMFHPDRSYGEDRYDPETGMVWTRTAGGQDGAAFFDGSWFWPHRRHLTPAQLRAELERHGFHILEQSQPFGGEVVCAVG